MTIDPQSNLQNYIDQWTDANKQAAADHGYLMQMISQMLEALKKGNTEGAFQIAETGVMPGAMTNQGDSMGQLAASMNVGSALQKFTTDSQNAMNGGKDMTPEQAKAFVDDVKATYDNVKAEMQLPKDQQWLDPTTATNILNSIGGIAKAFGASSPDDTANFNVTSVQTAISNWVKNPTNTTSNPDGKTGQQCIQNLQSSFSQWDNSVSAQSQVLRAQEQFAANSYTQFMNSSLDVMKSTQDLIKTMVQAQAKN